MKVQSETGHYVAEIKTLNTGAKVLNFYVATSQGLYPEEKLINTQHFFPEPGQVLQSLAISPDGDYVAASISTGEGPPMVAVWAGTEENNWSSWKLEDVISLDNDLVGKTFKGISINNLGVLGVLAEKQDGEQDTLLYRYSV
jgi:hypothetical protein